MRFAAQFFSKRTLLADRFLYASPDGLGLDAEDVEFESKGARLRGWFLRGERIGTVVFCPGNSANVSCHLEYVRMLRDTGYSVLCFDYRGFGRSEGVPNLREVVDDVCAACLKAREISGDDEPLGLFGVSLGANAAMAAAARADGVPRPRALVVEGLSDLHDMLTGLFSRKSFGPLRIKEIVRPDGTALGREPVELGKWRLPRVLAGILASCAVRTYPFEGRRPRRFVPGLRDIPTLLVHGVDDALLPFEAAVDVYNDLQGASTLWLIPGTGHAQEPVMSHRLEYVVQLSAFLGSAFEDAGEVGPDVRVRRGEAFSGGATFHVEPPPGRDRSLVTVAGPSKLWQRVVDGAGSVRVEIPGPYSVASALSSSTLEVDGWPRRDLDPLSSVYREEGYQSVFRRLVRAVNAMDIAALDAGLADYLLLERRFPFDFFAAAYCLRVALVARHGQPGWPAVPQSTAKRSLERFLTLWQAHDCLPDESVRASPAAWARRAIDD